MRYGIEVKSVLFFATMLVFFGMWQVCANQTCSRIGAALFFGTALFGSFWGNFKKKADD
jgi:hypothetical protein